MPPNENERKEFLFYFPPLNPAPPDLPPPARHGPSGVDQVRCPRPAISNSATNHRAVFSSCSAFLDPVRLDQHHRSSRTDVRIYGMRRQWARTDSTRPKRRRQYSRIQIISGNSSIVDLATARRRAYSTGLRRLSSVLHTLAAVTAGVQVCPSPTRRRFPRWRGEAAFCVLEITFQTLGPRAGRLRRRLR